MSAGARGSVIVRPKYSMVFGLLVRLQRLYGSLIVSQQIIDGFVIP
jgi:hypothetical protein